MNARSRIRVSVFFLAAVVGGCAPQRGSAVITEEKAIEIARQAIVGKVTLSQGGSVKAALQNDRYVVTFTRVNPPGRLGPDYDAQVTVDAKSGEVLQVLGAS